MTNCPKCRRILQSGYCATHGRIVPLIKKSRAASLPARLHGVAFQEAFDRAFIPSRNRSMSGAGQISASSPPTQNIIEPEAGATVFSTNTTTPHPASGITLHQFQSSGRKSEVYPEYRERKSSMLVMALRNPV